MCDYKFKTQETLGTSGSKTFPDSTRDPGAWLHQIGNPRHERH